MPKAATLFLSIAVVSGTALRAHQPARDDVMPRVAAYVSAYGDRISAVVATEHYSQSAETNAVDLRTGLAQPPRGRTLVSDFAIVKTSAGWIGFRDVAAVDGKDVRDREDRLVKMLMAGQQGIESARRVSDESARYNIGFPRNLNLPTTALFFFTPEDLPRFQFGKAHGSAAADEAHLTFRETDGSSLVYAENRPVPIDGELWVRPVDGTVTRTILRMRDFQPPTVQAVTHGEIDVTYRLVPELQMWLPSEMSEMYESRNGTMVQRVKGHAEYSNYRTFQTSVKIK